jgi:hypothetical protein
VTDAATETVMIAPAPPRPENAVSLELLGNGLLYSINYERFVGDYGFRGGASFFTWKISDAAGSGNLTLATFPFLASYYLGTAKHKLQLGLGATILYTAAASDAAGTTYSGSTSGLGVAATGVIGYRYAPEKSGFTFTAGYTPLVRTSKALWAWGGASAGWAF